MWQNPIVYPKGHDPDIPTCQAAASGKLANIQRTMLAARSMFVNQLALTMFKNDNCFRF